MCMCFQHVKPGLCLLQKTLLRAVQVKAGVVKKFAKLFHWYIFLLLWILFIQPMLNSNFSTKLIFFWIFFDLLSFNIHVIKQIIWNLADIWHIILSADPPNILLCEGTDVGDKSMSNLIFGHSLLWNLCYKILYPS